MNGPNLFRFMECPCGARWKFPVSVDANGRLFSPDQKLRCPVCARSQVGKDEYYFYLPADLSLDAMAASVVKSVAMIARRK